MVASSVSVFGLRWFCFLDLDKVRDAKKIAVAPAAVKSASFEAVVVDMLID